MDAGLASLVCRGNSEDGCKKRRGIGGFSARRLVGLTVDGSGPEVDRLTRQVGGRIGHARHHVTINSFTQLIAL